PAYLGNDSGISHLAAALATPSVVLFTQDKLAWQSWAPRAHTLVVSTTSLEHGDLDRVLVTMRGLVGSNRGGKLLRRTRRLPGGAPPPRQPAPARPRPRPGRSPSVP